jgi:GT2 family glycosyltransferase
MNGNVHPPVSVIIAAHNRWPETKQCLDAVLQSDYPRFEVVFVDSGSTDETPLEIKAYPVTHLRVGSEVWWSEAVNIGINHVLQTDSEFVLLLDSDCVVESDTIAGLVKAASRLPGVVIAPLTLDHASKRVRWAGKRIHWWFPLYEYFSKNPSQYIESWNGISVLPTDVVYGKGTMIRKQALLTIGLLRHELFPQYDADADWSIRARASGFRLAILPEIRIQEIHEDRLPVRFWSLASYVSQRSVVQLKTVYRFFKYCSPYKRSYVLLLVPFYLEFAWRCTKGFLKNMLGLDAFSRERRTRISK